MRRPPRPFAALLGEDPPRAQDRPAHPLPLGTGDRAGAAAGGRARRQVPRGARAQRRGGGAARRCRRLPGAPPRRLAVADGDDRHRARGDGGSRAERRQRRGGQPRLHPPHARDRCARHLDRGVDPERGVAPDGRRSSTASISCSRRPRPQGPRSPVCLRPMTRSTRTSSAGSTTSTRSRPTPRSRTRPASPRSACRSGRPRTASRSESCSRRRRCARTFSSRSGLSSSGDAVDRPPAEGVRGQLSGLSAADAGRGTGGTGSRASALTGGTDPGRCYGSPPAPGQEPIEGGNHQDRGSAWIGPSRCRDRGSTTASSGFGGSGRASCQGEASLGRPLWVVSVVAAPAQVASLAAAPTASADLVGDSAAAR